MKRCNVPLLIVLMSFATAAVVIAAADRPADSGGGSWQDFRVLATRNIFVRDHSQFESGDRPRGRSRDSGDAGQPVLTGIGQRGSERAAFVEDPRSGNTLRLTAGQSLEGGRVVSVSLDALVYEHDGVVRNIEIGQNLSGSSTTLSATAATSQPDVTSEGGDSSASSTNSILERLRQRRLQETKP